jgi:hypothetical protein
MKELTAFPFVASDKTGMIINTGMDLRDYFAAKAMQGFMGSSWNNKTFESISIKAYQLSDEMMKARK